MEQSDLIAKSIAELEEVAFSSGRPKNPVPIMLTAGVDPQLTTSESTLVEVREMMLDCYMSLRELESLPKSELGTRAKEIRAEIDTATNLAFKITGREEALLSNWIASLVNAGEALKLRASEIVDAQPS